MTRKATFRFYAELNDFLLPERRHGPLVREFVDDAAVKDMIESMGVPHTEVDLILINGEPAGFDAVDHAHIDRSDLGRMFRIGDVENVDRFCFGIGYEQPLRQRIVRDDLSRAFAEARIEGAK